MDSIRCVFVVFLGLFVFCFASEDGELCGVEPTPSCGGDDSLGVPTFSESFDDESWNDRWTIVDPSGKYQGVWKVEATSSNKDDRLLRASSSHKHHGIYAKLSQPFDASEGLYFQYEVKYTDHKEMACGGSYFKLLSHPFDAPSGSTLEDAPFSIMFGPDYCGGVTDKVHLIVNVADSLTGEFAEHHFVSPPQVKLDSLPHLYALKISPDDSFEIYIDGKLESQGNFFTSLNPPLNPPETIKDPHDVQPDDWDMRKEIADETAVKPEGWDDYAPFHIPDPSDVMPEEWDVDAPKFIPDPSAVRPEQWDDQEDGKWSAPLIVNPKCETGCGPWSPRKMKNPDFTGLWYPPRIPNPDYKGAYVPRDIPNPDYHENPSPTLGMKIDALAIEIWSTNEVVTFDNVWLSQSEDPVAASAEFKKKLLAEKKILSQIEFADEYDDDSDEEYDPIEKFGMFVEDNAFLIGGATLMLVVIAWYSLTSGAKNSAPPSKKNN